MLVYDYGKCCELKSVMMNMVFVCECRLYQDDDFECKIIYRKSSLMTGP